MKTQQGLLAATEWFAALLQNSVPEAKGRFSLEHSRFAKDPLRREVGVALIEDCKPMK
jgi:hypothetical protein